MTPAPPWITRAVFGIDVADDVDIMNRLKMARSA
jgi:hypothetical protein